MNLATAILLLVFSGPKSTLAPDGWSRPEVFLESSGLEGALTESALRSFGKAEPWQPPPCIGNTCQPRVSIPVPGFEPQIDMRGRGGEVFASTLEQLDAGVVATIARAAATAGVRLEYRPPRAQDLVPGSRNLGQVALMARWRLDAWNVPMFQVSPSP